MRLSKRPERASYGLFQSLEVFGVLLMVPVAVNMVRNDDDDVDDDGNDDIDIDINEDANVRVLTRKDDQMAMQQCAA